MEQVRHNPGVFKQPNKGHKTGRHRSKGEVQKANNGKVASHIISRKKKDLVSKNQRKNRMFQMRKNKRDEIINKKRCIGTLTGCPHIVSIIPLSSDVSCLDVMEVLNRCDSQAVTKITETSFYSLESPRFKSKYNFVLPNPMNDNAVLDAMKISDTCLFVLSSQNKGIDPAGEKLFDTIYSFHLPSPIFVVQGLKNLPIKTQSQSRIELQKVVDIKMADMKLLSLDTDTDGLNLLHKLSQHKLTPNTFNKLRPYVLAEKYHYQQDKLNHEVGTLSIYGYVRSRTLNANTLSYLPSLGTYQINQIFKREVSKTGEEAFHLLQQADETKQETLESEAVFDEMNAEQTWPTEQELAEAEKKTVKKRVPKGTSDYQAAWILDSEDEEETDDDDDEDEETCSEEEDDNEDNEESENEDEELYSEGDEEMETMTVDENNNVTRYDDKLDLEEEKMTLEKIRLSKENNEFPDEVDTPMDQPARIRFQKYRGLKSFRTSPWDKMENLPIEYARIFQFEDLRRTFNKVSKESTEGAEPGTYVRIDIKNIPSSFNFTPGHPLIMYSLLKHENKMSIVNLKLKRVNHNGYPLPIKSKETLIYHIGARRFEVNAIFSQHTTGNKHKFERFMPEDTTFIASMISPITFSSASVLVYKRMETGKEILVASGSLFNVEPHRIVLKRIVLSGHPFKVSKKNAVTRYMFFNPEDVNWFKPVELRTRYGRRGHIKESLGTHGHMKCQFNDVMKTQDCVLMNLYKRVYPKWSYQDLSNDFLNQ